MGDGAILSSQQITHIKENKAFSGFHVEFKEGLDIQQSGDYAAQRYKAIRKGYNAKEKEEVIYVLFDLSNDFMFVKGTDYTSRLINSFNRKQLYHLQINDHADPFNALCDLAELRTGAYEAFLKEGFFHRIGIVNPLLSVLDIATEYVAPSNSFWHKILFYVPFGMSLMVYDGGDTLPVGMALLFLVLYIVSSMGMLVKLDMKARSLLFWVVQCVFYALTMVCFFNIFYPSFDVAYGMQAFGYSDAFQTVIGPYYDILVTCLALHQGGWLDFC